MISQTCLTKVSALYPVNRVVIKMLFHYFFQLSRVQLYQSLPVASDRAARAQQQRTTTPSVSFSVLLVTPGLDLRPGNASKTEPGVVKISFAKVKMKFVLRYFLRKMKLKFLCF